MRLERSMWAAGVAAGILASASLARADAVEDGKKLVEAKKCSICHAVDGKGGRKEMKPLNGITEGKTDEWLLDAMKDPKKTIGPDTKMPSYKDKLTDDEIKAVIAYLKTLKK